MRKYFYIATLFYFVSCSSEKFAVIKMNDKYGTINKKGEIIIKPVWDNIDQGMGKGLNTVLKDELYGYIDKKGNVIIEPQYYYASSFSEGLAAVGNSKHGFINSKGDTIIPFIYDNQDMKFYNGLSKVQLNNKWGYINKKGKIVIPIIYSYAHPFFSKYAQIRTEEWHPRYGSVRFIDKKGKIYFVNEIKEKYKLKLNTSLKPRPGIIKTSTGQGKINNKGDTIIPPHYILVDDVFDRMIVVLDSNEKCGAYRANGQLAIIPQYDELWRFRKGIAPFKINDKWGYINRFGKIVIEPIFDEVNSFYYGLAYVVLNENAGFINKKGKYVIQPIFQRNDWKSTFK